MNIAPSMARATLRTGFMSPLYPTGPMPTPRRCIAGSRGGAVEVLDIRSVVARAPVRVSDAVVPVLDLVRATGRAGRLGHLFRECGRRRVDHAVADAGVRGVVGVGGHARVTGPADRLVVAAGDGAGQDAATPLVGGVQAAAAAQQHEGADH